MHPRTRVQDVENLALKRQKEFEKIEGWRTTTQYFKDWEKNNSLYGNWTSSEYYKTKLSQMEKDEKERKKKENLERRREKLRKLLREEQVTCDYEIMTSPREKLNTRKSTGINDVPTNILKEVNIGLKLSEEEKRRHEAELKLYHKWRNENPIIKEHESRLSTNNLKLAWLDQQIEKRMAQEEAEKETKKMLEEQERKRKEEEEYVKKELENKAKKEHELMAQIEEQLKAYKINETYAQKIAEEAQKEEKKKQKLLLIHDERMQELEKEKLKELCFYNQQQSKMKLRMKALKVEEELKKDRIALEEIQKLQIIEAIENKEKKLQAIKELNNFYEHIKRQQILEQQRQDYLSFIFDSEAKQMWTKQERLWREEQDIRNKLFNDVLCGLKEQIEHKIERKNLEREIFERERENSIKNIDEAQKQLAEQKRQIEQKKCDRRKELDQQIMDKKLLEREKEIEEQKKKLEELENIRKEEERLRNELMLLQRGKYHPSRYNRKTIFW